LEILDIDANRYSDQEVETLIKEKDFDVVAMGCIVTGFRIIKKITSVIKKYKNVPVIVGNSVASSITPMLLNRTQTDIAVIGEGDVTIVELLNSIEKNGDLKDISGLAFKEKGEIIFTPKREVLKNIDELPFINWELFDINTYIEKSKVYINEPYPVPYDQVRSLPINTARGCAFKCTFCYHVFIKDKYRVRSPKSICDEISFLKEKYEINYINFFDELTFYSKKQCEEFVDTLLKYDLNIAWKASTRGNLLGLEDLELAKKLKKSGCIGLGYSLESANADILKAMNKKMDVKDFIAQTKVLGYPQETEQSLKETFDVCYDADIYPSSGYLLPLPGTPMYDYAVKTGKIEDEEDFLMHMGDRQDFSINLTNMEYKRIEEIVTKNLKRISDKLGLGLDDSKLIKTGHYRAKNK
jgi:radical SAM superfamily enzyme YgiQ (UPF0313 family)